MNKNSSDTAMIIGVLCFILAKLDGPGGMSLFTACAGLVWCGISVSRKLRK